MVKHTLSIIFIALMLLCTNCGVDFSGFSASTDLDYRLEAADEFVFIKKSYRNLGGLGNNYSFIVISDTHITGSESQGLEKIKNKINSAKFIVVTGDITQSGTEEELNRFVEIAQDFGIPVFPVIGNHDIYFENYSNWRRIIGSTRYRIDSDSTTLFVLDSANAFLGDAQIRWFEEELKSAKKTVFVFSHVNFFADQIPLPNQLQFTSTTERAWFISLLDDHCKAVFTGHIHKKLYNKIKDTHFITLDDFITKKAFVRVYVKNGDLSWEFEEIN